MKLLITGGSGYVGRHLIKEAIESKHEVILASRSSYNESLEWLEFDLKNTKKLCLPGGVDTVIHLAAITSPDENIRQYEIIAARNLIDVSRSMGAKFVFISSQAAKKDGPTSYSRTKWDIEQNVLESGGLVIRLGQVYGGEERGLFGTLVHLIRKNRVLPGFIPPPMVQPIHVDDCATGILKLVELDDIKNGTYCLASPQAVSFTRFLQLIATNRVRCYRLFFPVPITLFKFVANLAGGRLATKLGLNRLNSLFELPFMATKSDLELIGLKLRALNSGMHRSGDDRRRRLILEGTAMLMYLLKNRPTSGLVRRYVRMIETIRLGCPLDLPKVFLMCPVSIVLLNDQVLNGLMVKDEFYWRLDAATIIAEASKQGAPRFLGSKKPTWRFITVIRLLLIISVSFTCRVLGLIFSPVLSRLYKRRDP